MTVLYTLADIFGPVQLWPGPILRPPPARCHGLRFLPSPGPGVQIRTIKIAIPKLVVYPAATINVRTEPVLDHRGPRWQPYGRQKAAATACSSTMLATFAMATPDPGITQRSPQLGPQWRPKAWPSTFSSHGSRNRPSRSGGAGLNGFYDNRSLILQPAQVMARSITASWAALLGAADCYVMAVGAGRRRRAQRPGCGPGRRRPGPRRDGR
jgi:hypothetical protein